MVYISLKKMAKHLLSFSDNRGLHIAKKYNIEAVCQLLINHSDLSVSALLNFFPPLFFFLLLQVFCSLWDQTEARCVFPQS